MKNKVVKNSFVGSLNKVQLKFSYEANIAPHTLQPQLVAA